MNINKAYYPAVYEIITTGHWLTDEVSKALKVFGISEPQYNVLRILRSANGRPITVGQILNRMVQRSSNITRIVDKLVAKNLALREECPTNRRKMDIKITDTGLELLRHLDKNVQDFHEPFYDKLSYEELITLKALIQKLKAQT